MSQKIVIYTEKDWLIQNRTPTILLYPFWDYPSGDAEDPDYGRFDEYIKSASSFIEITEDVNKADVFLLPFEFSFETQALSFTKELSNKAKLANKKLLIFYNSDIDIEIPIDNAIIFRTSFYKSSKKKEEYAFIGWSLDFKKYKTNEDSTEKTAKPSISYCGYVDYLDDDIFGKLKRAITQKKNLEIGPVKRGVAVRALLKNPSIQCNFIIRKGFWAIGMDKNIARKEYAQNMYSSDYGLVTRGGGNFSYRLYELLSAGKIPVFVNTDSVLPFDDIIDWRKYVVWVEESEVENIAQRLIDFHKALSEEKFIELKMNCRKLYEDFLSPVGFFSNIHRYIND